MQKRVLFARTRHVPCVKLPRCYQSLLSFGAVFLGTSNSFFVSPAGSSFFSFGASSSLGGAKVGEET